jgi:segregation and condensation protein A
MYKIKLPNFEGPFDLLLYFIKKDELNIYDIPIAKITKEFLNYIRLMKFFDIELAGEFVFMSANLMYIKSQMMLPRPEDDGSEDYDDPRTQLVERLLEYKQIKDGAQKIENCYEDNRYNYYRHLFDAQQQVACGEVYKNTTLFDLMRAFQKALDRNKPEPTHKIEFSQYTIEEKMQQIILYLKNNKKTTFANYIDGYDKIHIVVTFLAILNLLRDNMILLKQPENFSEITIYAK